MTRRRLPRVGGIAAAVAAAGLVVGLPVRLVYFPGRSFDPAVWQADAELGEGARLEMADRLVARGTLTGKTRAEVVEVLGEPPPTPYFSTWDLVYWLGAERGIFRIDSEWLVVRLGADGRVADSRIVRD